MTKAEIVKHITSETGIDGNTTAMIVDRLFEKIRNTVAGGEEVFFRGFGTFGTKHRAQKIGQNMSKGTSVVIPAHNIPSFKPAKVFKQQVLNSQYEK